MLTALTAVFAVTWLVQVTALRSPSDQWAAQARTASLVWHQDWRVFTRVPIGADTVAYDARDLSLITMYATSSGNRWGLSRIAYVQWMEIAAVDRVIPADQWHDCAADSIEQCRPVLGSISAFPLVNPTRDATVCGRIVFSRETALPWQDAKPTAGRTRRITAISLLDLTCGR
jgi:hypothetical protein